VSAEIAAEHPQGQAQDLEIRPTFLEIRPTFLEIRPTFSGSGFISSAFAAENAG